MKGFSHLSHLECPTCGSVHDAALTCGLCDCGSPLLARYDIDAAKARVGKEEIGARPADLWRYHELLPVRSPEHLTTLGEGMTPLVPLPRLGGRIGLPRLLMKDEGLIPTGTFKARGAAVGVSRARELGIGRIAMSSQGNAGAAWAAYAARAGMESLIATPLDAPLITRKECTVFGARLYLVDGYIRDAGALVAKLAADDGWFDVSTLKEPYRIEGKKTMGIEIVEQLGWRVPDVIIYPTGGGVGLIGIHKALRELQALGWIGDELPRLVSVQATGCAPVVRAYERRERTVQAWEHPATVAFGIGVAKPLGDFLVLDAIYDTDGCAIAVEDSELLDDLGELARLEGQFVCPEGAAAIAAARRLREAGWLAEQDEVVVLNTGAGLKYPETVDSDPPSMSAGELRAILGADDGALALAALPQNGSRTEGVQQ